MKAMTMKTHLTMSIHPISHYGKLVIDKIFAILGLTITACLLPFIALAIKLDSPGPIFYKQIRVGRLERNYTKLMVIYKFRSMVLNAEANTGESWAQKNDPRITRIGKWLRCTRLDELPQLYNVLRGDMSFIGPRPERPAFVKKLITAIPFYEERIYGVTPGITGLAQVNLGYDESIESVRQKVAYDHAYALILCKPWQWFLTDCCILLNSIKIVILCKGR